MTVPVTRASSSGRWIHCPESAWLEPNYPDIEHPAAKEGTAAHEMAELILKGQHTIEELVDRQASNGIMMTGEMVPHVQMYVDHIQKRGVAYWIEEVIEIKCNVGTVTGRCDGAAFAFDETTNHLFIDDFKYGYRPVEVFKNWQQLIYAMGMFTKIGSRIQTITMTIIQPRGQHHDGPIRSWTIGAEELERYMLHLWKQLEYLNSPNRKCHTGAWCRDCKVQPHCAAAISAGMNAIDVIMKALPDTKTAKDIADLLDILTYASKTVDHLLDSVNARAEAMILNGQPIPGYGYEPGKGKRKFKNPEAAIAAAAAVGIDITNKVVCTPLEAERRGLSEMFVKQLATTPSTAPRLKKRDVSTLADRKFKT